MIIRRIVYTIVFLCLVCCAVQLHAQVNDNAPYQNSGNYNNYGNNRFGPKKDTTQKQLEHRDAYADSITISYHYFDSTRNYKLDSSISDFYSRYPISYNNIDLGNFGGPEKSLLFSPYMKSGWDAGFHAYDAYGFSLQNTKQFTTTRPYTELAYMLGSKSEQYINLLHTQNRKSNVNFTFEYRLINAPGLFKNQNTNDNHIRITIGGQSKNKRYSNTLIFINNKIRASDNGGIQNAGDLISNDALYSAFQTGTVLYNGSQPTANPFNTNITTGSLYNQSTVFFRQNYDFGQKDSLVTDSVTYKLFYPRIRLQYTIQSTKETYIFQDQTPIDSLYQKFYHFTLTNDTVFYKDAWNKLTNEFGIVSYPEKNNQNQFLKVAAGYENIAGGYYPYVTKYGNIYFAGEYRNRTRNQKWDLVLAGKFYGAGDYAGDYEAYASLERTLNKNNGYLQLGFQNVNRSQSSIFANGVSAFPVITNGANFNKENISRAFANLAISKLDLSLTGEYYLVTNMLYMDDFFHAKQYAPLFNVLHIAANKKIKLANHWNWYIEAHVQQKTGNPPVNIPAFLTRQRFAFEGNFFRNLFLSTGVEVRYYTSYNADSYSPFTGQFVVQDTFSTKNNRPDINLFFNFRIKSFKAFVRLENLNTVNPDNKYRFSKYNFTAPNYPQRSMWFRLGIWWNFVN